MNTFRKETNEIMSNVKWFILKHGIFILIFIIILGFILQSLGIISMNIRREIIQHSQQYTESKTSLLYKYYNDYLKLQTEISETNDQTIIDSKIMQQKNLLKMMAIESNRIPKSEIPKEILQLIEK